MASLTLNEHPVSFPNILKHASEIVEATTEPRARGRVVRLRAMAQGVLVELAGPRPRPPLELAGSVDIEAARRLRRSVKRLGLVTVMVAGDGSVSAVADGIGNRLPFHRRVAASTAFGLAMLGVPTLVSYATEEVA